MKKLKDIYKDTMKKITGCSIEEMDITYVRGRNLGNNRYRFLTQDSWGDEIYEFIELKKRGKPKYFSARKTDKGIFLDYEWDNDISKKVHDFTYPKK